VSEKKSLSIVDGDMIVTGGKWMLVFEWAILPDKREAPHVWAELPPDCRYRISQVGGKSIVQILHPAQIDARTMHEKKTGWIFPSPPDAPQS
jgi:hypothetical protein